MKLGVEFNVFSFPFFLSLCKEMGMSWFFWSLTSPVLIKLLQKCSNMLEIALARLLHALRWIYQDYYI